eukprot:CAMPEP_0117616924 /NCGR_PEP_ID=MMETSP0784-20121206/85325_1 /TAXON_ID=39447 /ORGANISM="" /LENGTH=59 /DNA_ID=CAMNT_0005420745 /DNA_START=18 /DNA_END=194 /DNA_ORIENTATION=+
MTIIPQQPGDVQKSTLVATVARRIATIKVARIRNQRRLYMPASAQWSSPVRRVHDQLAN